MPTIDRLGATGLTHEGLATRDPGYGLGDGLADAWAVTPDGLTWTFHLKEDVLFHDGTPLTARSVADHFQGLREEAVEWLWLERVEALDGRTVAFHFSRPLPPDRYADPLAAIAGPGEPGPGTGPFRLEERTEDGVVLRRSDDYRWGPSWCENQGPAWLEGIVGKVVVDPARGLEALAAGDLHVLVDLPLEYHAAARELPGVEVLPRPEFGLGYLAFRLDRPPLDDPGVRRAINLAIDRERLVREAFQGVCRPAYGLVPPPLGPAIEDTEAFRHDPAAARDLLAEAGHAAGLEVTLLVGDGSSPVVARVLGEMLAEVGIAVAVERHDPAVHHAILTGGGWQLSLLQYRWADPDILGWLWAGGQAPHPNVFGMADPALDRLLGEAEAAPGPDARDAGYREVQRYLIDRDVWAPLWFPVSLTAVRTDLVEGYRVHAGPDWFLDVWLRREGAS